MIKIEVPIGDIFDKMSILEIKASKTKEADKIKNINKELNYIKKQCHNLISTDNQELILLYSDLKETNQKLWDIEDNIRIKEKEKKFDDSFISLARSVYLTNDHRADIKKKINLLLGSKFIEEKIYND